MVKRRLVHHLRMLCICILPTIISFFGRKIIRVGALGARKNLGWCEHQMEPGSAFATFAGLFFGGELIYGRYCFFCQLSIP